MEVFGFRPAISWLLQEARTSKSSLKLSCQYRRGYQTLLL